MEEKYIVYLCKNRENEEILSKQLSKFKNTITTYSKRTIDGIDNFFIFFDENNFLAKLKELENSFVLIMAEAHFDFATISNSYLSSRKVLVLTKDNEVKSPKYTVGAEDQPIVHACASLENLELTINRELTFQLLKRPVVIYIDDEIDHLSVFKDLNIKNIKIFTYSDPELFLSDLGDVNEVLSLYSEPPHCSVAKHISNKIIYPWIVMCDQRMPKKKGAEVLEIVSKISKYTRKIMLTGHSNQELTIKCINDCHVDTFLTKPWDRERMKNVLETQINALIEAHQDLRCHYRNSNHQFINFKIID
ncbi:MAG: response regulator [Oligoflexia bacterium]|nr:response regulator [Oligoflexia bacterium]